VVIKTNPRDGIRDARKLLNLIRARGVNVEPGCLTFSFDPVDNSAVILLVGVSDDDLCAPK
jgi:hypothetical protein